MEGDLVFPLSGADLGHFNPLPPHGGRQAPVRLLIRQGRYFNPLPPHGGRPDADRADHYIRADFNPLPPHGGRPPGYDRQDAACLISIHSLRMEGDPRRRQIWTDGRAFQSTPSAWRETLLALGYIPGVKHFNPLPPHGGRLREEAIYCACSLYFNPLPPHGGRQREKLPQNQHAYFNPLPPHGGRRSSGKISRTRIDFNPLPPHGGRLCAGTEKYPNHFISIHSLRMEGDKFVIVFHSSAIHFNPLPPHGGRPRFIFQPPFRKGFQSTPSAWRETALFLRFFGWKRYFNPLPPHGGRPVNVLPNPISWYFNPLPPHGGRHSWDKSDTETVQFQSTPSAWRETSCSHRVTLRNVHFNPLPPHGGRPILVLEIFPDDLFQSTPSAWRETCD